MSKTTDDKQSSAPPTPPSGDPPGLLKRLANDLALLLRGKR